MNQKLALCSIVLVILPHIVCQSDVIPEEYNKAFRPKGRGGTDPLVVQLSMKINGIYDIDTSSMSLSVLMYLRTSWVDERLVFPVEYLTNTDNATDSISLSDTVLDALWVPDTFFRDMRGISSFTLLQRARGIKLTSDNIIYTSSMYSLQFGCPMIFRNFPFDTQECHIEIGSFFYNKDEVAFKWHELGLSLDRNVRKNLEDYDFKVFKTNSTHCFCTGCFPPSTPCVQVILLLKRRYFAHVLNYFIPSALLIMVSWASFFWPPEVIPGRTVLVITSLLTVSSLYAASKTDIPKTSYVKAIDAWMFFAILVGVLNLLQYAVILQLMKRRTALKELVSHTTPPPKLGELKEKMRVREYDNYVKWTEIMGRVGEPIVILIFNAVYWPYFFLMQ